MVQLDWQYLWSTGMQVRSPAWHSVLKIWPCQSCCVGYNCSLDLIPRLGTPYIAGWPKNKNKNLLNLKKKERKEKRKPWAAPAICPSVNKQPLSTWKKMKIRRQARSTNEERKEEGRSEAIHPLSP